MGHEDSACKKIKCADISEIITLFIKYNSYKVHNT